MSAERPRARGLGIAALGFAAAVACLYASPLLTGRTFTGRDLLAYNLPLEKSIHDAYARGRLPVWTPEVSGGRPLMPNPNTGALYPVRAALAALSFPAAMRIYPILHWAAAGIGMILFLASLEVSGAAAWLGAATYAFSGVVVSEVFYPHIQPGMALLPWLLWACSGTRRRPEARTLWLALFLTLDMLAGDVFTVALGILCAAVWILLERPRAERGGALARLGIAVALAALAALPQIVATALWIPETNRGVVGLRLSEVVRYSVSPWRLLELAVPYPFGETWRLLPPEVWGWRAFGDKSMGLFSTLYAGALAAMAAATMWRRREAGVRFASALLVFGLGASILPSLIPASLGRALSPVALRNPEKFAVAATLALAIFAARAFEVYRRERFPLRAGLAVTAGLAAAAAAAAIAPHASARLAASALAGPAPFPSAAAAQLPRALAEGCLLWLATLGAIALARRPERAARGAALAILTLVPIAATRRVPKTATEEDAFGPTRFARFVAKDDPRGDFRTLGEAIYAPPDAAPRTGLAWTALPQESWIYYTSIFWGRGTVLNYDFDAGDLARVESLRKLSGLAAASPDGAALFANLCLRYGVRPRGQPPVPGFRAIGGTPEQAWDRQDAALPDLRLATRWREEPGAIEAAEALGSAGAGDLVLETGRRVSGRSAGGTLRVLEKSPERLRLVVEAPEPTWLFVLRAFWTYRTVTVDGREVEPVAAYLAYTAIPVPAGRHDIDWRERVPGGLSSRFGPVAAGMAALGLAVVSARRQKK